MQIPCVQNRVGCGCIVLLLIIICVSYGYLLNVNVCFSPPSFGRQFGGRRGCECITLEPSEMIVVSNVFNTHTHKHTDTRTRARAHTRTHTRARAHTRTHTCSSWGPSPCVSLFSSTRQRFLLSHQLPKDVSMAQWFSSYFRPLQRD